MSTRRTAMLVEMGIKPHWRLRAPEATMEFDPVQPAIQIDAAPQEPANAALPAAGPLPIGQVLQPFMAESASPQLPAAVPLGSVESAHAAANMDWPALEQAVSACRACRLCERRKQAVLGVGDREADWMFIGEGPGAEEDERGEPFVGQAGRLLDAMLGSVGLARGKDVYIANAVKCRPPGNRTPEGDELLSCRPYLDRQIELIKPRLLIALGRPAAQTLLGENDLRISASRKKLFQHVSGIPLIVTYHPAYLLRNLTDKSKAWEDLCFAQDEMARLK